VNEPQINVDHFYPRPTYHVVGLLPEQSEIPALSQELASAGVDVSAVEILRGEHGELVLRVPARPADRDGIAALLHRHQVHDVGYFGPGTFEQFPP
jgi:hypothetical protein